MIGGTRPLLGITVSNGLVLRIDADLCRSWMRFSDVHVRFSVGDGPRET
jgi:hypothetical protein